MGSLILRSVLARAHRINDRHNGTVVFTTSRRGVEDPFDGVYQPSWGEDLAHRLAQHAPTSSIHIPRGLPSGAGFIARSDLRAAFESAGLNLVTSYEAGVAELTALLGEPLPPTREHAAALTDLSDRVDRLLTGATPEATSTSHDHDRVTVTSIGGGLIATATAELVVTGPRTGADHEVLRTARTSAFVMALPGRAVYAHQSDNGALGLIIDGRRFPIVPVGDTDRILHAIVRAGRAVTTS